LSAAFLSPHDAGEPGKASFFSEKPTPILFFSHLVCLAHPQALSSFLPFNFLTHPLSLLLSMGEGL